MFVGALWRRALPVLILSVLVPGWSGAEDKKPKELADQEKILGHWKVVSGEMDGMKVAGADFGDMKLTFTTKSVKWGQKGSETVESQVHLEPAQKPKQIDLWTMKGEAKKGDLRAVGIYKFDGDKLVLCITVPNKKQRPTEFTAPQGSQRTVYILERTVGTDAKKK